MTGRWRLDRVPGDAMRDWCEALRDDNPIHVDRAAAARLGFGPHCVNPGPANLAYLMNMMMEADGMSAPLWIEARFLANLVEGDAAIADAAPGPDGSVDTVLRRGDGEPVVVARFAGRGVP